MPLNPFIDTEKGHVMFSDPILIGFYVVIAALLIALVVIGVLWWRSTRPQPAAVPATPTPTPQPVNLATDLPVNLSLVAGVVVSLAAGVILGFWLTGFLLGWFLTDYLFLAQVVVAITIAAIYFMLGLHNIKVAHRGVVLLFGRRFRVGRDIQGTYQGPGEGLEEGLNWLPLPPPLMTVIEENVQERKIDLNKTEVFTQDNVIAPTDTFLSYYVNQPYEFQDVEDVPSLLRDLALRAIRRVIRRYPAADLLDKDKKELSEEIMREIQAEFDSTDNPNGVKWGVEIKILRVNNIRLPVELETAFRRRVQEPIEGEFEHEQARRRREQAQEIIKLGVTPDTAFVGVLVDAEKPNAQINSVNIRGLESVGPGLERLGGALTRLITPGKRTK